MLSRRVGPGAAEVWRTLRLALAHRREPLAYGRAISWLTVRYLESRGAKFAGRTWLDVGTGSGALPETLRGAGARVVALDADDRREPGILAGGFVLGNAQRLPFRADAFDGVVSSNVLEHVRQPWALIDEAIRVCRPGGIVYLSWTNWYSPFGGHDWSPFHYGGPRFGLALYRMIFRRTPLQVPGQILFPVHVGTVVRGLRSRPARIVEIVPRYWPGLWWLGRIPVVREVTLWNCVILMQKLRPAVSPPAPVRTGAASSPRDDAVDRRRRAR
jgi:SAM-dependent methyltransferase